MAGLYATLLILCPIVFGGCAASLTARDCQQFDARVELCDCGPSDPVEVEET